MIALYGQQTRLRASVTSLGLENKRISMVYNGQTLFNSKGVIAMNQIGLLKMISKETSLRFTKNMRLSIMDTR